MVGWRVGEVQFVGSDADDWACGGEERLGDVKGRGGDVEVKAEAERAKEERTARNTRTGVIEYMNE